MLLILDEIRLPQDVNATYRGPFYHRTLKGFNMTNYVAGIRPYRRNMEASPTSKRGYFVLVAIALICGLFASRSRSYAQNESVIYQFDCINDPQNGCSPEGGVIAKNGALFGTTILGGTSGLGIVFALMPPSTPGALWSESVLHSFLGGADGVDPAGALLAGAGNVVYGATVGGGASNEGTVFSLQPPSTPGTPWVKTVLYSFAGGSDAAQPGTGLIADPSGTLYGTTGQGGASTNCTGGCGAVYSLTPPATPGGAWTETVLYSFTGGADGGVPAGGLLLGQNGVLYGTATEGGTTLGGVAYALTPPAVPGGAWTEDVLYSFKGRFDGSRPQGKLVADKSGRLFGTCANSDANGSFGGTLFELSPPAIAGGAWAEHTLWDFGVSSNDGQGPFWGVILGNDVVYGTTDGAGGNNAFGTVFQLTPPTTLGGSWTETILHAFLFTSRTDGYNPSSGLMRGPSGALYGTTSKGAGSILGGTVYEITP